MILIGNAATQLNEPNKIKDYDIVCTNKEQTLFKDSKHRIDFHDTNSLNNSEIEKRFNSGLYFYLDNVKINICSLRGLAAIKRSHLYRDYFFDKHITQYHHRLVAHLHPDDTNFIKERTKLTKEVFKQGNPCLNKTNEDFFDDAVPKVYDHDYLHTLVAYNNVPVYTMMKRDHSKAWCEKDMWDTFPKELQLQCVAEECYVIAIERFMVRNNWDYYSKKAYIDALKKVCTTLTSGWFRDFAIDNYPDIVRKYDNSMFNTVQKILN